ncbi:MAG: molybdopterin-dependent oxidoreductase, partial [Chthoniobacterales bacterium]
VSNDGNPNTAGAQLLGITHNPPGAKAHDIATAVRNGTVKALLCFGEDPRHYGLTEAELARLDLVVCLDILPNTATKLATAILPGAGFAEKRGSMVNVKGRIQRLNRATQPPAQARDDFEILSDLLRALGAEAPQTLEGVFKEISAAVPAFENLTLAKLGDQGIPLERVAPV